MKKNSLKVLLETLQGVMSEQKALQGYALDFVIANDQKDLATMLRAMWGSVNLFRQFLLEFAEDDAEVAEINRGVEKLMDQISESKAYARNKRSKG